MPFEMGRNSTRNSIKVLAQKRLLLGNATYPWAVVLKVHSWAAQIKDGRVSSCAEIARREGITRARVSQLWPLGMITKEQMQQALSGSTKKEISLRSLIQFARDTGVNMAGLAGGNLA